MRYRLRSAPMQVAQQFLAALARFAVCSTAWGFYVNGSLRSLITTGEGQPNGRSRPRLPAEEAAAGQGR